MHPYDSLNPTPVRRARIEIIPLIDVIFFLLATFVLFTLSLNKILFLPTQLPAAAKEDLLPAPPLPVVTIQVSAVGTYYWDGDVVSAPEVSSRLRALYAQNGTAARVLVTGDNVARFGPITHVLDEVTRAGITQVALETRVRATGK